MPDYYSQLFGAEFVPQRCDKVTFKSRITFGSSYNKFIAELRRYGTFKVCPVVWNDKAMAYRCNTCARVPTMALCEACFEPHKHQGTRNHRYKRFAYLAPLL